jgi:hypothetical protein
LSLIISLSMMTSSCIHFPANDVILLFLMARSIPWCIYVPYFHHPFITWWAPWLIPQFGHSEESCSEYRCAGIPLVYWFSLLWIFAQKWHAGLNVHLVLLFWRTSILLSILVTLVYIPQQYGRVPFLLLSCQYLLLLFSWW